MGPLTLTGLALFGAAVAIGQVASRSAPAADPREVTPARRLAMILIAFATGCGVLGVVVGILSIELDGLTDGTDAPLVAGLAIAGAVLGLLPILRNIGDLDPWVVPKAAAFIAGLAVLGVVITILTIVIEEGREGPSADWTFLILGLISAAGAIGLGRVGGRSLRAAVASDDPDAAAWVSRAVARIIPFEVVAYGASMVGIFLVVTR